MGPTNENLLHARLHLAREAAFEIHGVLLEATRREYERDFGRVADAATLLKLVTSEPAFSWIRPLTAAIADADELLASSEPEPGHMRVLVEAITQLLKADAEGAPFQRRYHNAIQASPDVAVTHCQAIRRLRGITVTWT